MPSPQHDQVTSQVNSSIDSLNELSSNFSEFLTPIIALSIGIVILMVMKTILTDIAKGLRFKFTPTFNEGDMVILDGDEAIIVKIGLLTSVFGITKKDGTYCWRYIPNNRIEYLKLEKIISKEEAEL